MLDFWTAFAQQARAAGFEVVTVDRVDDPAQTLLVSHCYSAASEALVDRGALPAVLMCAESPVVAWDFYHRLPEISARFRFSHLFEGARSRVRSPGGFHPTFAWSIHNDVLPGGLPWPERRLLTFVAANKKMERAGVSGLAAAAWGRFFSRRPLTDRPSVRRQLVCLVDRVVRDERFSRKREAVIALSHVNGFDFYGRGWGRISNDDPTELVRAIERSWRGELGDRLEALQRYRFTLVIENSAYPGYITEKMFDAFRAGSIPVYDGAPDVDRYIPAQAFVRIRDFKDYPALVAHLEAMTPAEAEVRRDAARRFLASPGFDVFDTRLTARRIVEALERC